MYGALLKERLDYMNEARERHQLAKDLAVIKKSLNIRKDDLRDLMKHEVLDERSGISRTIHGQSMGAQTIKKYARRAYINVLCLAKLRRFENTFSFLRGHYFAST